MLIRLLGRKRSPFRGKQANFISKNPLFYKVMKRDRTIVRLKKRKK